MAKKHRQDARTKRIEKMFRPQRYTRKTVYQDREYGIFWYAWLWQILRPVLIFLCSLLIVIGIVATGWDRVYNGFIAAPDETDATSVKFTISSGESISKIGSHLEEQEIIRSSSLFKYYIQFYGLTNQIQSGVYYISRDMNLFDVADTLASGKATNERTIRIIPGWTCEDIADYLVEAGALDNRDQFLNACRNYRSFLGYSLALYDASANADLYQRTYPLEGYLAPDTYRIYLDADANSIVKTLLKQTDVVYNAMFSHETTYDENGDIVSEAAMAGTDQVKLTDDEVFILASIIEKEASTLEDMKKVSAVFYNRLAVGMRLQSDPTATYLTGTTRIALTDADISVKTAYNTYRVIGLPVGPICNPSKSALEAALNPDETFLSQNYLFFCAAEPGSGKLVFAQTNAEHEANVARYRPLWEEYDRTHVSP